jgi:hypothetical protein
VDKPLSSTFSFGSGTSNPMGGGSGMDSQDVFGQSITDFDVWDMESPGASNNNNNNDSSSNPQRKSISIEAEKKERLAVPASPRSLKSSSKSSSSALRKKERSSSTTTTKDEKTCKKSSSKSHRHHHHNPHRKGEGDDGEEEDHYKKSSRKSISSKDKHSKRSSKSTKSKVENLEQEVEDIIRGPPLASSTLNATKLLAPVLSEMDILRLKRQQHLERSKQMPLPNYDQDLIPTTDDEDNSDFYSDNDDDDDKEEEQWEDKIGILMKQLKKEKEAAPLPPTPRSQVKHSHHHHHHHVGTASSCASPKIAGGSSRPLPPAVAARRRQHMNELIGSPSILKKKTVSLSSKEHNAAVSQNASFSAVVLAMQDLEEEDNTVATAPAASTDSNKRVSFGKAPFTAASLKNAVKEKVSLASLRSSTGGSSSYLRRDGGRSGTTSSNSSSNNSGGVSKERRDSVRDSLKLYLDSSPPSSAQKLAGIEGRSVNSAPVSSSKSSKVKPSRRTMSSSSTKSTSSAAGTPSGSRTAPSKSHSGGLLENHFYSTTRRIHATGQVLQDGEQRSVMSAPAGTFRDTTLTAKCRKLQLNF